MSVDIEKLKSSFMKENNENLWLYYQKYLHMNENVWDYIVLTSSNLDQKKCFELEINNRLKNNRLNSKTKYLVISDPENKRVGSGGATLNALKIIQNDSDIPIEELKILLIHSGGDSKRVPQYSNCGKLFSPVQREICSGIPSTLFDEFMILFSAIPPRISTGVLILSGDVLLSFNPMQIDFHYVDSGAISIKEDSKIGCNHGVFLSDQNGIMESFLHKQSGSYLNKCGAVNSLGKVDIDTGAVFFSSKIISDLLELISSKESEKLFINDEVRINLYGDLLYPLARSSNLKDYLLEAPEYKNSDQLIKCRKLIWNKLSKYNLKVAKTSPSQFIHFGTTKELIKLVNSGIKEYKYLGWKRSVLSNVNTNNYSVNSSYIDDLCTIGKNSYIERSIISNVQTDSGVVLSNVVAKNICIPKDVCLNTLKLKNGKFVTRIYGICDNPKCKYDQNLHFLGTNFSKFVKKYNIDLNKIWSTDSKEIWDANLFQMEDSNQESVESALELYNIINCKVSKEVVDNYFSKKRISLNESFNTSDNEYMIKYTEDLETFLRSEIFFNMVSFNCDSKSANQIILNSPNIDSQVNSILNLVKSKKPQLKYRVFLYISTLDKKYSYLEDSCYSEIRNCLNILDLPEIDKCKCKDSVKVEYPIRINFGGGWSDTPPYCMENGGTVLNGAYKLNGELPIKVYINKIKANGIRIKSKDLNIEHLFSEIISLKNCSNTLDEFSLIKASLIITGVVRDEDKTIEDVIKRIGSGIEIITDATLIPKGSGLGTSSILSGACLSAIYEFLGINISLEELCYKVLIQEQMMGTGGGWQDQVGGIMPGIKLITTYPGPQIFDIKKVNLSEKFQKKLNEKLVLIYTGQRRLAKNLLRSVMNNYILNNKNSITAIKDIKDTAKDMYESLCKGDLSQFCKLMNKHWEHSKKLDSGSSNYCIEQILKSINDMIDGRMICGAGGGGFLQVILKDKYSFIDLEKRLIEIYQDSGVKAYKVELYK